MHCRMCSIMSESNRFILCKRFSNSFNVVQFEDTAASCELAAHVYSCIIVLCIHVTGDGGLVLKEAGLHRGTQARLNVDAARLHIDSLGLN